MDLGVDEGLLAESMSATPIKTVDFNVSDLTVFQVSEDTKVTALSDPVYEQFLADVWVGIVLTLMVLSCVCFMCSCLIYHKFQEWKHRVVNPRTSANLEAGTVETELPSYTIASGLPTYEEALEQLKKVKELQQDKVVGSKTIADLQETSDSRRQEQMAATCEGPPAAIGGPLNTLSVFNLFGIYNRSGDSRLSKPT